MPFGGILEGDGVSLSPGGHISVEFWVLDLVLATPLIQISNGNLTLVSVTVNIPDIGISFAGQQIITVKNAANNTLSDGWTFVGASFGWDGSNITGGMFCFVTYTG